MRTILIFPALLALGACNVSTDQANNSMTIQYNSEAAADATNAVANTATEVADDIGNSVQNTSDKIQNRTDDGGNDNLVTNTASH